MVRDDGSERVSCARVEEANCAVHCGVEVPMPIVSAAFGVMANASFVVVAHFVGEVPDPEPQAAPLADTRPVALAERQPVPVARYRAEVEAIPET